MSKSSSKLQLPGRYKNTGETDDGGFGFIELFNDDYLDRLVVFKSLKSATDDEQLNNELVALSRIKSKHVVQIFDVVRKRDKQIGGVIIEYVDGESLDGFHKTASTDMLGYQRVLYQIASALADLHECDIIHRDLKLQNIRRNKESLVKLFDFGISSTEQNYQTQVSRGSLIYAAPELFSPPVVITKEMDIYAFGVCAWALASPTFPGQLQEIPPQKSAPVPSIATILPRLPPDVVTLIDACLNIGPRERPNALTIRDILKDHLVHGEHNATIVSRGARYLLNRSSPAAKVNIAGLGGLGIKYNQLTFNVESVSGDVYINNHKANVGDVFPSSCVLTFGAPHLGASRRFVSFNASHPEVVL